MIGQVLINIELHLSCRFVVQNFCVPVNWAITSVTHQHLHKQNCKSSNRFC